MTTTSRRTHRPITLEQATARLAAETDAQASDTARAVVHLAGEVVRLREALRRAADEPNIDRARAIADKDLYR